MNMYFNIYIYHGKNPADVSVQLIHVIHSLAAQFLPVGHPHGVLDERSYGIAVIEIPRSRQSRQAEGRPNKEEGNETFHFDVTSGAADLLQPSF